MWGPPPPRRADMCNPAEPSPPPPPLHRHLAYLDITVAATAVTLAAAVIVTAAAAVASAMVSPQSYFSWVQVAYNILILITT